MKVRALCAAGLVAAAAVPATASAGNSIRNRLHRADIALNRAQDAADDGNDAKVVSSLRGANRQTALALKATLRLVARDRPAAGFALAATGDQLDGNAQVAMDLLGGASSDVVDAIAATLTATDTGRGRILTTIQGLGDTRPDWADALAQLADDAVGDLITAADDYDGLSSGAEDALTSFVSHETDAAGAFVAELGAIAADGDAEVHPGALDQLDGDVADAADALGSVTGLGAANSATVAEVVTRLGTLGDAVAALVDALDGGDAGWWEDEFPGPPGPPVPWPGFPGGPGFGGGGEGGGDAGFGPPPGPFHP